jgi:uncharacterized lipoprotein NlpE involved in copper resistance
VKQLTDQNAILKGKQFPFRYLTAYKAVGIIPHNAAKGDVDYNAFHDGIMKVRDALQTCMDVSVANVPKLKGKTLILIDNSGSMTSSHINEDENRRARDAYKDRHGEQKVEMFAADIAGLFGAMSAGICDTSTVEAFATTFAEVPISLRDGVLTNAQKIRETYVNHNTYGHLPIMDMTAKGRVFDRIILFSDMQCYAMNNADWDDIRAGKTQSVAEAFTEYQRKVNPNAFLHCIDLTGYGTTLMPEGSHNVCALGGWSDKIFQFINMFEQDRQGIVDAVNNYKPKIRG